MTNLPDIDQIHPQEEPDLFGSCVACNTEIYQGDDVFIAAQYPYCSPTCFANLSLTEGNLERMVAGE